MTPTDNYTPRYWPVSLIDQTHCLSTAVSTPFEVIPTKWIKEHQTLLDQSSVAPAANNIHVSQVYPKAELFEETYL